MVALLTAQASGQPAWGPVYQWGHANGEFGRPTGYFKQVSTGYDYTIGVRPNGTIEVWGVPGDGLDYDDVLSNIPSGTAWTEVEAGWVEAIALRTNGTVAVWGLHLTDYPFDEYQCEGEEITLADCEDCLFTAVAAGENIMAGIIGIDEEHPHFGDLFIWGAIPCFDPRSLSDDGYFDSGTSPFVKVSCSGHHVVAQRLDGTIAVIGNPVGNHQDTGCLYCCEEVEMFNAGEFPPPSHQAAWWGDPPTTGIDLFTAGHGHNVLWTEADGFYGWGKNLYGQTGVVTTAEQVDTVEKCGAGYQENVTTGVESDYIDLAELEFSEYPIKIEGGKTFTTALLADGTLRCWGDNSTLNGMPCTLPAVGNGKYLDFSAKHHHGAAISACYADADGDGDVDMDDLTFFQALLSSQNIAADCNQSGTLSLSDYSCFYNLWVQGCD